MIQETILQVKRRIEETDSISPEKKKELLDLFSTLETEVEKLARTDREHAESIAVFTQTSTYEATRKEKREELHDLSLEGLSRTVQGFESSHPKLVEIVNSVCTALSNLGI